MTTPEQAEAARLALEALRDTANDSLERPQWEDWCSRALACLASRAHTTAPQGSEPFTQEERADVAKWLRAPKAPAERVEESAWLIEDDHGPATTYICINANGYGLGTTMDVNAALKFRTREAAQAVIEDESYIGPSRAGWAVRDHMWVDAPTTAEVTDSGYKQPAPSRVEAAEVPPMPKPTMPEYAGWCRYVGAANGGTALRLCDSDSSQAWRFYREGDVAILLRHGLMNHSAALHWHTRAKAAEAALATAHAEQRAADVAWLREQAKMYEQTRQEVSTTVATVCAERLEAQPLARSTPAPVEQGAGKQEPVREERLKYHGPLDFPAAQANAQPAAAPAATGDAAKGGGE